MSRIEHIKGALPIIARALGDKLGVEVKQGNKAQTDGNTIFVPPLAESDAVYQGRKFTAYELAKTLGIGFIVHEASHVRYTDFQADCELADIPFGMHLINILEDIRIEKRMTSEFPGTAIDLSKLAEILSLDGFFQEVKEEDHPSAIMVAWMAYKLRLDYLGQTGVANLYQAADEAFQKTFTDGLAIKFEALIYEVANCKSTSDVMMLAEKIYRMIQQEAEEEEKPQDGAGDDDQNNDNQTSDQNGDDDQNGSQSSNGDQSGNQDDQSNSGNQPQQSGNDGDDDNQNAGNNQQASTGNNGDDSEDKGTQVSSSSTVVNAYGEKSDANSGSSKADVLKQVLNATEQDGMLGDLGEIVGKALNGIADKNPDTVMAQTVMAKSSGIDQLFIQKTTISTNALRHRMQIMLQSHARTRVVSAKQGNKLRPDKLYQAKLGGAVFGKKIRQTQVNTAVKILLDISGSTNESVGVTKVIEVAKEAAFALAMTLDSINGMSVSVDVFPVEGTEWTSIERINSFNEPVRARSANFSSVKPNGQTPMAESLKASFSDLIRQREPRKVLFVITDGEPSNLPAAVRALEMIQGTGVEVIGLGIKHKVGHLFKKHATVSEVSELPGAVFEMMQNTLLQAA